MEIRYGGQGWPIWCRGSLKPDVMRLALKAEMRRRHTRGAIDFDCRTGDSFDPDGNMEAGLSGRRGMVAPG